MTKRRTAGPDKFTVTESGQLIPLNTGHAIKPQRGMSQGMLRALADREGPKKWFWLSFGTPEKFIGVVIIEEINGVRAGLAASRIPGVVEEIAGAECLAQPIPEERIPFMTPFKGKLLREEDLKKIGGD